MQTQEETDAADLFPSASVLHIQVLRARGDALPKVRAAWQIAQTEGVYVRSGSMRGMKWWQTFLGIEMSWRDIEFIGPKEAIKKFREVLLSLR